MDTEQNKQIPVSKPPVLFKLTVCQLVHCLKANRILYQNIYAQHFFYHKSAREGAWGGVGRGPGMLNNNVHFRASVYIYAISKKTWKFTEHVISSLAIQ